LRPKNLQDRARAVLAGCHVRPLVRRQRFGQVFDTHGIGLLRRCLLDRATEPSTFLFTSLQQVPHIGLLAWPLSIFSVSLRSCLACSSLRSASYTSGRTFRFLSISQHSFTVILYSQVLNAARWSNRFSEKYALTNTCCATSSTSSRRLTIPPATANTRCWCRRT